VSVLPLDPQTEQLLQSLQHDYDATTPDVHVIATQIVNQKRAKGQPAPKASDLAAGITSVASDHTTGKSGAPTLMLTLQDPSWQLLDSGFFQCDAHGNLLDVDLNYPEGSRFWWRINQVSPQYDHSVQVTFVPRIVAEAMNLRGPIKVDRAKRTRAEFLKMLWGKVHDAQGIEFYSRELDNKQPIGTVSTKTTRSSSKSPAKRAAKSKGVGANSGGLTSKGKALNATQIAAANLIMQVADQLSAPDVATRACVFAAIYESNLGVSTAWNPTYGGLLAGNVGYFGKYGAASSDAVAVAQITAFMQGTNGYQKGGAIKLAASSGDVAYIASQVEAPYPFDAKGYSMQYEQEGWPLDKGVAEADAIVQNGGGGGTSGSNSKTITVKEPYYFTVNAGEDYWTAMNRLAQEVNWELIVDGNRVYYDTDTTLIRQKVAGVIDRDDPTTLQWNYDWVNGHIATNFQIQIECDLFEFSAGEVLLVKNFGAASSGSTAKLPGRWLINEVQRNSGDLFSTFSLVQPSAPLPEPAPQTTTKTITTGTSDSTATVAGGFANPFPNGWTPGRLDMGYDGTFKNQIVAPFDGLIIYASRSFSNWGGYLVIQSPSSIGLPTKTLYFAEGIFPTVSANQSVKAGQQIAIAGTIGAQAGIPGNIEWGVAKEANQLGPIDAYSSQLGNGSAAARAMVLQFAAWAHDKLGVAMPSSTSNAGAP
jgi:murein DD-endopeptidase MepM/ murein hydrolase activator NlpD